ncbi:MAG: PaaI family thioesterase [Actinomycetia bacterium]|nr:PaaI family thioesterase [Actinomycetes bacterium]
MRSSTEAVQAITESLRPHVVDGVRMQATLDMDQLVALVAGDYDRGERLRELGVSGVFPYSPYIGLLNPLSPPATLDIVEGEPWASLSGEVNFTDAYNGPPAGVHGGVLAGMLDELLGAVCVVNDVGGFTGTLTIRYRSPSPLRETIRMHAWIERVEGRKTFAKGTFHHGDTLLLEGDGVFIGSLGLPGVTLPT